ncbi:MAG TPA: DNA topology modulation protein FlaR, partial [Ochrobactrum sp.]|nr:DNA topology modulation protein FlaR [Ochrobactrum sp.]
LVKQHLRSPREVERFLSRVKREIK